MYHWLLNAHLFNRGRGWIDGHTNSVERQCLQRGHLLTLIAVSHAQCFNAGVTLIRQERTVRMFHGKVHCPIQIEGAGLHIDTRKLLEVRLKRPDRNVLQRQGDIGLKRVRQHRTIHTDRSGSVQLHPHLKLQRLCNRNPHIVGFDGQGPHLDLGRSR
ncbi:MAG: hypothetical protein JW395_2283 [Nitrospira sp.]|nr:hypothetical protein [Nitrospira sp.]